ncbi:hypothetical protein [Paenibacillus kandeliae]|uniref:hypothetical protein n=1 Tax=Paenibacillus kandeliae TaxID=3231269 RepID=UPI00345A1762
MLIQKASFNTFFPKVNNIRKRAFDIEERLQDYYNQISLNSLPDEAPDLIPRIQAHSKNGHSSIEISLTNAQVMVNYDEQFQNNSIECLNYLQERSYLLKSAINPHIEVGTLFSGISVEAMIEGVPALDIIKNRFMNYKSNADPYDLECKITYILEDKYYLNLVFKNIRFYEGIIPEGTQFLNFAELNERANVLGISVDINDRHAFNHDLSYRSTKFSEDYMFGLVHDLFANKLEKMIEEGVIDL